MQILERKQTYSCPIFNVEERKVQLDNGVVETRWVVVRPPNVSVLALTPKKKFVLIEESRDDEPAQLDLPGGKVEEYQASPQLLMRQALLELKQEGGYEAEHFELIQIQKPNSSWYKRKFYLYAAWGLTAVSQELEKAENIQKKLLSVDEVEKLVSQPETPTHLPRLLRAGMDFYSQKGLI